MSSPLSSPPCSLPRWATPATDRRSYGPAVGRVSRLLGLRLMPWQRQVAGAAHEIDAAGRFAHSLVVVTVPRQSGKTTLTLAVSVHRCLAAPGRRVWYTAQTGQDARDKWLELVAELRRSPLARTATFRRTNGSESITFANGSTLRPFPPQPDALHGKQSDLVIIDEAWAFTADRGAALEQAIIPTQATRPGAQLWLISTAGTVDSAWLRSYVDRGRAADPGVCYFEWSIPDDADPADLDAVAAAHPAYGHTIDHGALERAAAILSAGDFARAYGNRWTAVIDRVIPAEVWAAAVTEAPLPGGAPAFGVDVAADRSTATISACVGDTIELIERRPGVAWVLPRLLELRARWAPVAISCDRIGPSGTVADECDRAGLVLAPLTGRDYANACAAFLDALGDGRLFIRRHPAYADAADAAARRPVGDGWAWARRSSAAAIDPLVSGTLAWWAYQHRPAPAPRPSVLAG